MYRELFKGFPDTALRTDELMREHTSFRVGGPVDLMVLPQTKTQAVDAFGILRSAGVPYFVVGNGSNLLVSDAGYRGVVVKLDALDAVTVDGSEITAEAGAPLARIANAALQAGLAGFEFASGIPGSFGGAVCMNAGAYGGEIKDVLVHAEVLDTEGQLQFLSNEALALSYRDSRVQREGLVVLEAKILLESGDNAAIRDKMKEMNEQRRLKQPLEYPSAGSTFKRPKGYFAGELIMKAGLAGYNIGGAMVSPKHCGFIVNTGNATAAQICELILTIQNTVREKFGVELEPEVKILEWNGCNS